MIDVERWRREFPILDRTVYMISNSLGAMPRAAAASLVEYADTWASRGVRAWEERWWEMPREVGNRIAKIIGAPPDSVSMHENVTTAEQIVLSSLHPAGRRNTIVCQAADFPSLIHLYRAQHAVGFDLKIVPAEPDQTMRSERILEAIDDTTLIVCMSHVLFRSSFIVDPEPIVKRAHGVGALVLLDTYQSAGIVPVDVGKLNVDFAVGGCLKWLCGGPGTAFLYTRPDLRNIFRPRFTGWVAHEAPFAFQIEPLATRNDAMAAMNGTPAIPAYYAALPGLDIINEIGVPAIRERSMQMTARLFSHLDRLGHPTIASREPERLAGTVAVQVPDAPYVARALKAAEYIIDYRPQAGIRISPHFYNTADEIDDLMHEIERLVSTRDYDRTSPFKSLVT